MKRLVVLVLTLGIVGVIANPVSKQTIQSENKNSQVESNDSQTIHEDDINMYNKGEQEQKKDTPIENPQTDNIDTDNDEKVEIIIEENIVVPIDDGSQLSGDKCEQKQKKDSFKNLEAPNIDTRKDVNENVEILIEESTNDDYPQSPGDFQGGSPLPDVIEDIPSEARLPGFIEDDPQLTTGLLPGDFAGSTQFPGFVQGTPQLPGFIGGIPQLSGLINDGPQLSEDDEDDFLIDKNYFREDMQKIEHEIMETAAGFIPTPLVFRRKQKPKRRFVTRRHFRRNPYRRHQFIYPYSYYAFYRPSSLRYY